MPSSTYTAFGNWLECEVGITGRSNKDVRSRLRRAATLVDVDSEMPADDLVFEMGKNPEFRQLSCSVRSQLRRALRLYKGFTDSETTVQLF